MEYNKNLLFNLLLTLKVTRTWWLKHFLTWLYLELFIHISSSFLLLSIWFTCFLKIGSYFHTCCCGNTSFGWNTLQQKATPALSPSFMNFWLRKWYCDTYRHFTGSTPPKSRRSILWLRSSLSCPDTVPTFSTLYSVPMPFSTTVLPLVKKAGRHHTILV